MQFVGVRVARLRGLGSGARREFRSKADPRPAAALRRGDRGDGLGRDRAPPARSRCSGAARPTFCVEEHHYALVRIEGLEPGSFNEYEVALDGERRWPEPGSELAAERDSHPRPRRPARRLLRLLPGRASARGALRAQQGPPRGRQGVRRAAGAGERDDPRRALRVARVPLPARRPGLRRRGLSADPRKDPPTARHRHPARRGGDRLRGVLLAVRGVVERSADPLAVLNRLGLDAVGRPRHERRLEHLPHLVGGDAEQVLVAPPRDGRGDELLGLPAPRQPLAAGARRRRALRAGPRQRPRHGRAARVRRRGRHDRRRHALELLPRPRRHPGDLHGLAGRSGTGGGGALDRRRARSGTGSSRRPAATSTTYWSRPRFPGCSRPASITSRPGASGSATAPGEGWRPAAPRS